MGHSRDFANLDSLTMKHLSLPNPPPIAKSPAPTLKKGALYPAYFFIFVAEDGGMADLKDTQNLGMCGH